MTPPHGFEILDELGGGAQAVVYLARRNGRSYALKMLRSTGPVDGDATVALRREAAALTRVVHPGLARIHDVGEAGGRPYLVMELVEGRTLANRIAQGPLDEVTAAAVGIDVAGALGAAHRFGLVHRDVKPSNIIVSPAGRAKLIDFGLFARVNDASQAVAGTFSYVAPEQTGMLSRAVDGRSDLYALGVVLYECVTGELPFSSPDVGELLRQHAVEPAPNPRALRPELSEGFAAIIARLLAKDPDDRYQTGEGLVTDLERLRSGDGGPAFPLGTGDAPAQLAVGELVGRAAELDVLMDRWQRARAGTGSMCLIRGPAGVGKTRLVAEVAATAARQGAIVLRGTCERDGAVPLAPLRHAVDQYLRGLTRLTGPAGAEGLDRVRRAAQPMASLLMPFSPALADLLGDVEPSVDMSPEQYALAVATFLAELVRAAGAAVLHLDDVQWLDPVTLQVLRSLGEELPTTPLLVAATAGDDGGRGADGDLAGFAGCRVDLAALDDAAVTRLVTSQLGGATVPDELAEQLTARSGGSPLMAVEYVRAAVDAGLVYPSWGAWVLDQADLDALRLADDALELVVTRLDGIDAGTREVLVAAAAMGIRFDPVHLAAVCGLDERRVFEAVSTATERRLVGPGPDGDHVFLHERIREALLEDVERARLRTLHHRIAEVLEAAASGRPDDVYAIARHYGRGDVERDPAAVVRACLAAGSLALSQQAAPEAVDFLETGAEVAERTGIALDAEFNGTLGQAYLRAGRFTDARRRLDEAIALEPDLLRRVALYDRLAQMHNARYDPEQVSVTTARGLAELGRPLPTNAFVLILSTLARFVAGMLVKKLKVGFGTATGERRERYRLESDLLERYGTAAAIQRDVLGMTCGGFRQMYPANRLGLSQQYIRTQSLLGATMMVAGRGRAGVRIFEHLREVAAGLGDPGQLAYARQIAPTCEISMLAPTRTMVDELRQVVEDSGRWLDAFAQHSALTIVTNYLNLAGNAAEAAEWFVRTETRLGGRDEIPGNPIALCTVISAAMTGRDADARRQLELVRDFIAERPELRTQWAQYIAVAVAVALETDGADELFEQAMAHKARLGLKPKKVWPSQQYLWPYAAYIRLERCRDATAEELPARLAEAKAAIRELNGLARFPIYQAHRQVVTAAYRQLTGDPDGALRLLVKAETTARGVDCPILRYEIARLRARTLYALDLPDEARQYAGVALTVAAEEQWVHRVRWIRAEFGLDEPSRHLGSTGSYQSTVTRERYRRRLDALQQLSLAAATVLDPQELVRVALDETIRIFGAERAFLFLVDEATGQLLPHVGRDSSATDLTELTGYSTTFVERIRDGADAQVLTADSDGRSVGSQSALVHGLRSVMVAPMRFKDRLLGVVYLDSRVAKGIFTVGDVDMLVAITNHVAVSLETARAARLEVAVRAARQQRDLAETLRNAITEVSGTLDPDEVLRRMLTAVAGALGADSGFLLRCEGADLRIATVWGATPVEAVDKRFDAASVPVCGPSAPARGSVAAGQPAPLPEFLPSAATWISMPLTTPGTDVGGLLVASRRPEPYTDADVDIVAALAGQAMVAYDKARLFERVRQLATQDALTGVANRRHLLELAEQRFAEAIAAGGELSAVMVDVDHFKRVNDTFGHQVGDEVIAAVAQRMRAVMRPTDLVGRYGGEEFLLVFRSEGVIADDVAERLRTAVNGTPIDTAAGPLQVTVSVGIGYRRGGDGNLAALVGRADQALYVAKEQGRDRVATI